MNLTTRPIYLDCNATTPIDPRVRETLLHYIDVEYGNAGSRTHVYGQEARKGVQRAREQVAAVVDATPEEVIFTSGATEANNLAILGLAEYGLKTGKRHILSTQIEHKAVLEPLEVMQSRGFEVELVTPTKGGFVEAEEFAKRLREDTLLVSVMHVNNETGVIQPLHEIADTLENFDVVFHVDAAQGFGKEITRLKNSRIDMISISGHKIHAPQGIGALIVKRARRCHRKLRPIFTGGKQERGLRAGTAPVPLICSLGTAAYHALSENQIRKKHWEETSVIFRNLFHGLAFHTNGDESQLLGNTCNFRIENIDAELLMLKTKNYFSISSGSACTSDQLTPSHVLSAMSFSESELNSSCRASWCHLTDIHALKKLSPISGLLNQI